MVITYRGLFYRINDESEIAQAIEDLTQGAIWAEQWACHICGKPGGH